MNEPDELATCDGYACNAEAVVQLKAWGPGVVRSFCEPCADIRLGTRGYVEVDA